MPAATIAPIVFVRRFIARLRRAPAPATAVRAQNRRAISWAAGNRGLPSPLVVLPGRLIARLRRAPAPATVVRARFDGNIGGQSWAMPAATIASIVLFGRFIAACRAHTRQQPLFVPDLRRGGSRQPPSPLVVLFASSSLASRCQQPFLADLGRISAGNLRWPQPSLCRIGRFIACLRQPAPATAVRADSRQCRRVILG